MALFSNVQDILSLLIFSVMASSSCPLNEELQCSICLDVFTDPVTTPCGHNFCRTCLNKFWTNTQTCFCPLCKEKFSRRPDLKINTPLREVVQHFKEKKLSFYNMFSSSLSVVTVSQWCIKYLKAILK
uniref:RING-type domain-containing protein n=1 Tax=Sinocyclocheilus rhinocerous TaxID=307959 RepID=A0A673II95_9TELE